MKIKNSQKGELSLQDFAVPLQRLLWAIIGVIAMWLNVDLPDAIGDSTIANMAVSGFAVYVGSILVRLIRDYSGGEHESKNQGAG